MVQKTILHGKRHDNKNLKLNNLLSRNFVVMAQAPNQALNGTHPSINENHNRMRREGARNIREAVPSPIVLSRRLKLRGPQFIIQHTQCSVLNSIRTRKITGRNNAFREFL